MHFPNTYPPDRDLSVGERYPTFGLLGPGVFVLIQYYSVVLILNCFLTLEISTKLTNCDEGHKGIKKYKDSTA